MVALVIVALALEVSVMVLPLMAVMAEPSRMEPTVMLLGTEETVTELLLVLLVTTLTEPETTVPRPGMRNRAVPPVLRVTRVLVPSVRVSDCEAFGVKVITLAPLPKANAPVCSKVGAVELPVMLMAPP